jgi:hypothetical protein
LTDSEVSSLFSGLGYPCNKVFHLPQQQTSPGLSVVEVTENGKVAIEHYSQLKSVYVALGPLEAHY